MSPASLRVALSLIATACSGFAASADSLEEVQKKIVDAVSKLDSFSADMSMKTEMEMGGMKIAQEATGSLEFMRKNGVGVSRTELKTIVNRSAGGQDTRIEGSMLTILDGEFSYIMQDQMGQKSAVKMRPDPTQSPVPSETTFKSLSEKCDVTLLPDENIDGIDCYVIDAVPKQHVPIPIKKLRSYYAKQTGMPVRLAGFDQSGNQIQTTDFKNARTNPALDPERFSFKLPEGVKLRDLTVAPTTRPAVPATQP